MGKFPHSIVGTSEDLFVEFVTSSAGTVLYFLFLYNNISSLDSKN